MTTADFHKLGFRIVGGKAVKIEPTAPRKPHERVDDRYRSKTERDYAARLDTIRGAGEIVRYGYECMKVRISASHWYTPDFFVVFPDGHVEIHEVKGYLRRHESIAYSVVAEVISPIPLVLVQRAGRGWTWKEVR